MSDATPALHILLIEPHFVLRRTVVAVSRELGVGLLQEATSIDAAMPLLAAKRFDGIVLDIGTGKAAIELLSRLRKGAFACDANVPVVALTSTAGGEFDARLAPFGLLRTLTKPFKIGELLQAMQQMAPAHA